MKQTSTQKSQGAYVRTIVRVRACICDFCVACCHLTPPRILYCSLSNCSILKIELPIFLLSSSACTALSHSFVSFAILPIHSSLFPHRIISSLFPSSPLSLSLSLSLSSLPLLPAFSVLSSSYFNVAHFLFLRVEFEAACEDLFARLTAPIDAALKMAGKSITDVQSVELLGEFKTALFTIILYLCREFSNVVIAIVFKLALF